jgi:hypothetical protein
MAAKKYRIIYLISFCICIPILIDAGYSPLKGKAKVVLLIQHIFNVW